ncbi:Hypothetical predicted protein [Olea europaea subsp. europaea]|uniref:DRBM domain-containing protein n=1 Tax=Olea europaea subsp. europaea TaxID=158383 RepID=A0A8S0QLN9_OLEEU|nr:Hypothetical predicted protein [Olea europaea subsp. europaea]
MREGPDHVPRFKVSVNFNGEVFVSPTYCTTLRQTEHAAAEVALNTLSARGPSRSLTASVFDESGVYKNLLQETAHKAGLDLPLYTTIRTGPGHVPVFTSTVELAGMSFTGESAKTKKQAEKNAAIAAWSSLKTNPKTAPTQIMKNSQAELQEASAIVETDKDELLNGISKFIKKPIEMSNNRKLNNLLPDQIADDARKTHIRTSLIGLTSPSKIAIPARVQSTKNSSSSSNEVSDPSMRSTTTKLSNTETLSPNK